MLGPVAGKEDESVGGERERERHSTLRHQVGAEEKKRIVDKAATGVNDEPLGW